MSKRHVYVISSRPSTERAMLDYLSLRSNPPGLYRHPDGNCEPGMDGLEERWYSTDLHLMAQRIEIEGLLNGGVTERKL